MHRFFTLVLFSCAISSTYAQCPQFLKIDTSFCSGGPVNIIANAAVLNTQLCGDSIDIIFNAAGTALAGDTNVYFHSGPQFNPNEGWQGNYTVGTWGADNGVGRMVSTGTNIWSIRINPRTYYNYPVDSCLNGIYMDFRNFNGNIKVSNADGSDIYLYTATGTPTSTFTGISGTTETQNNNVTYLWSDGNTSSSRSFTTSENLTVTATGVGGCQATGTVIINAGSTPVNLGPDIVRCNANIPVTLNAGSGFVTYQWLDHAPSTNATLVAVNEGSYWVAATTAGGCVSHDTITITNSSVLGLLLTDTLTGCGNDTIRVNAATSINANGDSVTIVYDATQGQTGLVGASKVYMHSSPETDPGNTWGNVTIGNWGLDDGVGEMKSLGNNKWTITIAPLNYYLLSPDTPLLGIYMVFRNATGSATGKTGTGGNIILTLTGISPTSTFTGITGSRKAALPLTYNWSNGAGTAATYFTSAGTYTVTVADNNSCSATASTTIISGQSLSVTFGSDTTICSDSVLVLNAGNGFATYVWNTGASTSSIFVTTAGTYSVTVTNSQGCSGNGSIVINSAQSPVVTLGPDTTDCSPVVLNAGAGFNSYVWNTGASTETITVSTPGTYSVTVSNTGGCKGNGSVTVDSCASVVVVGCGSPVANFSVQSISPGNTVTFKDNSQIAKIKTYLWEFGDGNTSNDTGSVVYTYGQPGVYTVTLIVRDSCGGVDSITKVVDVNVTGVATISGLQSLNLYPNPTTGSFNLDISLQAEGPYTVSVVNQLGQTLLTKNTELAAGRSIVNMDAAMLASGIYTVELMNCNQKTFKKLTITR